MILSFELLNRVISWNWISLHQAFSPFSHLLTVSLSASLNDQMYTMFDWYRLCIMAMSVMCMLVCYVLYLPWVCLYVSCCHMSCLCLHLSWMDVTVMFPECPPKKSSCRDTRIWTYPETNHHKLDISPFYIQNTFNMYEKFTRVKSISERPKDV
jgi:hypothetical protein